MEDTPTTKIHVGEDVGNAVAEPTKYNVECEVKPDGGPREGEAEPATRVREPAREVGDPGFGLSKKPGTEETGTGRQSQ